LPAEFPFAVVLILGVALLAIPFWRSTTHLQGHVRAGTQAILETLAAQSRSGQDGATKLDELRAMMPGLGEPIVHTIGPGSKCIGRSLKDLNLRGLTGATVLAIERAPGEIIFPTAEEILRENDTIILTGTREAVSAAQDLLRQPGKATPGFTDGDMVG
jgi:CPA2 family monovalent cation:H+ antiporter-2